MSESPDLQRWRPQPFLPAGDARDGALIFVVAVLCFLACLTALGVIAGDRAARGWTDQLVGEATVIVRPKNGESPDAAAARAAETLAGVEGVSEARALEREKAYDLIRPWLGDSTDLDDLPVPRLVAVELTSKAPAEKAALEQALKAQGLDAVVDDHSLWIADIKRGASLARWTGAGIFLVIALAAAAVIAFATRAGLAARREIIETLHYFGAEATFISRLFQIRFAYIAGAAGVIGAVAAAVVGALLRMAGGGEGITPVLPFAWRDLFAVVPCPLIAAAVAAASARFTALSLVRELE